MFGSDAWAAEPAPFGQHARSAHLRAYSMEDLEVEPSLARPLAGLVRIVRGPAVTVLRGGWTVPVFSGHFSGEWERRGTELLRRRFDDEPADVMPVPGPEERGDRALVGYVWLAGDDGVGEVTVELPDRADALRLANRMVLGFGEPRDAWAPVAHGEAPVRTAVTEAIVLSVDGAVDRHVLGRDEQDPFVVVVWDDRGLARRMGDRAQAALRERERAWRSAGLDPGVELAWDRLLTPDGPGTWVVDLLADRRWGLVVDPRVVAADPRADRWLTVLARPTGADDRRSVRVSALGLTPGGRAVDSVVSGELLAPAVEPPLRPRGWEAGAATGRVLLQPANGGSTVTVAVRLDLTLQSVGGAGQVVDLVVPKVEAVPGTWVITAATLPDGTSLVGRSVSRVEADGADRDDDDDVEVPEEREAEESPIQRLVLPEPVPDGGVVTLHLEYQDTWPVASMSGIRSVGGVQSLATGNSSGLRQVLPALSPGGVGRPWDHLLTVGVPTAANLVTAVSGATVRSWEERGWTLTEATCEVGACRWPDVAVGRFMSRDDPAEQGFPAVKVRLLSSHYGAIEQLAPEARRVIQYYQRWLPPFPLRELEVFEQPEAVNGFTWIAPYGMVALQTANTIGSVQSDSYWNPRWAAPHLESGVYAHEIAHQYFGHLAVPATQEDFWIAESFSELFAAMYVGAAFSPDDYAVRMKEARKRWEQDVVRSELAPASLSLAYDSPAQTDVVYRYGPFVLGEMLRKRIGTEAFFQALDAGLRERPNTPVTSERVQAWFEDASGQDLEPFFDFWVHGGFVPDVALRWSVAGERVTGTVTADVPFGTFDLPVVVSVDGVAQEPVWVTVTDGVGTLDAPGGPPGARVKVALDPDHATLTGSRRTTGP